MFLYKQKLRHARNERLFFFATNRTSFGSCLVCESGNLVFFFSALRVFFVLLLLLFFVITASYYSGLIFDRAAGGKCVGEMSLASSSCCLSLQNSRGCVG